MSTRRYSDEDDSLSRLISGVVIFYFLYLIYQYLTNRTNFWRWVIYGVLALIILSVFVFLLRETKTRLRQKYSDKILAALKNAGQEEYLKNFINRFGMVGFQTKFHDGWSFRNYKFEWDRINDFKKILEENKVTSNEKDVFYLLRYYIQKKEEGLTRESIRKAPQKFGSLSGVEFEGLLYRLYEAMGYKVEATGKSGDQGGDLIANKDGDRLLIQAKCYRDWSTGNAAVQQVVGAMKFYDCNKAVVVTTSHFTNEAIALAQANKTELVSKERLQELILQFLGESWS